MRVESSIVIAEAKSPAEIAAVRKLFVEYAEWLGFSLAYQNFDDELASLPEQVCRADGPTSSSAG